MGSLRAQGGLSSVTAAVLAGGLGTRLRPVVADRPKVLAPVRGRPFLSYLLDYLSAAGIRSVVLCTGYLGAQVQRTFGNRYKDMELRYSREPRPLGTGGALRFALPHFSSDPVLVMNGDSFCTAELRSFWKWHGEQSARGSLLLVRGVSPHRYGIVEVGESGAVTRFAEKEKTTSESWISAGVYLLSHEILASIPAQETLSLEYDIFPRWVGRGLFGYRSDGVLLDIGTPDDFIKAEQFLG